MRRSSKVHAHDESNIANVGDIVSVRECKPFSKRKHGCLMNHQPWRVNRDSNAINTQYC